VSPPKYRKVAGFGVGSIAGMITMTVHPNAANGLQLQI
jgi:hypothetical protein